MTVKHSIITGLPLMIRTVIILFLLAIPIVSFADSDEILKRTKWGMSPDEVLSILPGGELDKVHKGQYERLLRYEIEEYGGNSMITMAFVKEKLVRISYTIYHPNSSIRKNVPIAIRKKYGAPTKRNSLYGDRRVVTSHENGHTIVEYSCNEFAVTLHYHERCYYYTTKELFEKWDRESVKKFNDSF